jgi:ethanolamine utilization protein EutQ (cupin superfamily)
MTEREETDQKEEETDKIEEEIEEEEIEKVVKTRNGNKETLKNRNLKKVNKHPKPRTQSMKRGKTNLNKVKEETDKTTTEEETDKTTETTGVEIMRIEEETEEETEEGIKEDKEENTKATKVLITRNHSPHKDS